MRLFLIIKSNQKMHYSPYIRRKESNASAQSGTNGLSASQNFHQTIKRKTVVPTMVLGNQSPSQQDSPQDRNLQSGQPNDSGFLAAKGGVMQIEELEEKVSLIMLHNEKLMGENQQLQMALRQGAVDRQLYRLAQETQVSVLRLRGELEAKCIEADSLNREVFIQKEGFSMELVAVTRVLEEMRISNYAISEECERLRKEKAAFEKRLEVEAVNRVSKDDEKHGQEMGKLQTKFAEERKKFGDNRMETIVKLEEVHEKQKRELQRTLKGEFQKEVEKFQSEIAFRCKAEREKAEDYIQKMSENAQMQSNVQNELLKKQIQTLRASLESRKKVLLEFVSEPSRKSEQSGMKDEHGWFQELMKARQDSRKTIEHFMRESQLLKVKLQRQHELDVKEAAISYSRQIEFLSVRNQQLDTICSDLRVRYEEEIRSKLQMKRNFEIKLSQLKNFIKKLRLDLDKASDEYRLSIEGIKVSQMALSSHLIIDTRERKVKEGFYEQQLRKLRVHLDKKDEEREIVEQQGLEKVRYYADKVRDCEARLEQRGENFERREADLLEEFQKREREQRMFLESEKQSLKDVLEIKDKDVLKVREEMRTMRDRGQQLEMELSERRKDIQDLRLQLDSAKTHVQAMKLEMDMCGFEDKSQQANKRQEWKVHFERRIRQVEEDKENLRLQNEAQGERMAQVLVKYKDLEGSLEKTVETMRKRTHFEKRVLELGVDRNLIKNLAELFDS